MYQGSSGMNQRQLYITMFCLIAICLVFQMTNWNNRHLVYVQSNGPVLIRKGPSVQDALRYKSDKKFALGLTLSGGGVKCMSHAGALKALEEEGFKPDVISGVSAGAVVAALYADGYSPDSILSMVENVKFSEFFRLELPDGGFFTLKGFKAFLDTVLRAKTFEELKIPLLVVATDLDAGKSVVFDKGPLVDALIATCSVPILFSPYTIDGVNYVDGGVLLNFPASVIRPDCHYLIGMGAGPLNSDSYEKSMVDIALRSYRFIYRSNSNAEKQLCDVLIEPIVLSKFNGGDIRRAREIFNLGYSETKKILKEQEEQKIKKAVK